MRCFSYNLEKDFTNTDNGRKQAVTGERRIFLLSTKISSRIFSMVGKHWVSNNRYYEDWWQIKNTCCKALACSLQAKWGRKLFPLLDCPVSVMLARLFKWKADLYARSLGQLYLCAICLNLGNTVSNKDIYKAWSQAWKAA